MQIRTNDKSVETTSAQTYQLELTEDQTYVAANLLPEILDFINTFGPMHVDLLIDMAKDYQPKNGEAITLASDIVSLVVAILHNKTELRDIARIAVQVMNEDKVLPEAAE